MNLIKLSIIRPVFAWILMFGLICFGAIALNKLGTSQLPDVDFPVLSISVSYEGASPEIIESELIEPIEERLLEIEGIQQMKSSVRQGSGSVTLDFAINRNVDVALQEVQAALSQLRWPTGVEPPLIRKTNPEDSPIMFIGVVSDQPIIETLNWIDSYLLDQLRFIPGIGEVSVGGFSQRNLRIWPDLNLMEKYDLTLSDLISALKTQHIEGAAGQFKEKDKEFRVRWLGEGATPEQIGSIRILSRGNSALYSQDNSVKIRDIARVEDGLTDIRRVARIDGSDAIAIGVKKQRGVNEVDLAQRIYKKIEDLQPFLPNGTRVLVNIDFTRPTAAVVSTTHHKLIGAGVVTILVCLLFLGSWSAALNILFSIPTSIIGTFLIIYFSGFTLNLFTLLALTLAISIVVDDAIMLLENIIRHSRMGKSPALAAYDGAIEILPAATAATLAVIAVFIPVIFMDGIIGKFFFQFGITMSAAVLLSLLEAVTITPMRASVTISKENKQNKFEVVLENFFLNLGHMYRRILTTTLKYPITVCVCSFILFGISLLVLKFIKKEFVPMQDQDLIVLMGQTTPGSSLDFTIERSRVVEDIIKNHPDVKRYFVSVGAGGPLSEVNQFMIPMFLNPRESRKSKHTEIMEELRNQFKDLKGIRISMRDNSTRGLTSGRMFPVSFTLSGPNLEKLDQFSQLLIKKLEDSERAVDMDTDFKNGIPELRFHPNRESMARLGVSVETVASTISTAIAGSKQSKFTSDGKRYDIRIKIPDSQLNNINSIEKIRVRNSFGNTVPLKELVQYEKVNTYQSITRLNRQRSIGIFGNLAKGQSQGEVLDFIKQTSIEILPPGYSISFDGASAGLNETFSNLLMALLMGLLVAYMILAVQFNSFVHPISVLLALPFSISGALLTLWLFNNSLNLFSFIGLIVLMGIAKKNSILLVEYTNHIRKNRNQNSMDALIEACPIRLRPIIMTSVATILAAIPLIVGNSMGQETRTPMGLTIIGGTLLSTIMTLLVVPSFYLIISKIERSSKHVEF